MADVSAGTASVAHDASVNQVVHRGGCHCGAVRFEFEAPADLIAWDCNFDICAMKRNTHTIVPGSAFKLLAGEDNLSCYQFGTNTARHLFCKTCGICSYYVPRSNPDGAAVTVHCIDPGTVASVTVKQYDGQNWEASYQATGIQAASKPAAGS
ncbi:hypothetical protein OEZ85_012999 [Tetradesmus obliquus]|uniref:CENP-V/GFA domain-containing protein n=1 Tax=Tetradesmus obliquus TaxID=3088 RepID=A0ABY8U6M1_TETOB|nr:hypothetical protein OEZ85_012999 [Tetradesmus obliquus]